MRKAAIINAAEWARSPRAQAHAAALLHHGFAVQVFSHGEAESSRALSEAGSYEFYPVDRALAKLRKFRPHLILGMTPPVLSLAWIMKRAPGGRSVRRIVDWHNLGFSRLALSRGDTHPGVRAHALLERYGFSSGVRHLAVSHALGSWMTDNWGFSGVRTLHDTPVSGLVFSAEARSREHWLREFGLEARWGGVPWVVYPHSWGDDEFMDWILEVAPELDRLRRDQDAPMVLWVTGRGPAKEGFIEALQSLDLSHLAVVTPWIPMRRYLAFLGCCDLGLCMHRSSSQLDLPMKIADFHAAGIPGLIYDYGPVLDEVIDPESPRYRRFKTLGELTGHLKVVRQRAETEPAPTGPDWYSRWIDVMGDWLP